MRLGYGAVCVRAQFHPKQKRNSDPIHTFMLIPDEYIEYMYAN